MSSDNTDKLLRLSLLAFECVMALAYVGMSYVLLFTTLMNHSFQYFGIDGIRIGLGVILGLYGLFRVVRAFKKLTLKDE